MSSVSWPLGMSTYFTVTVVLFMVLSSCAQANSPPYFVDFPTAMFVAEDQPVDYSIGILKAEDVDDNRLFFNIRGEIARQKLKLTSCEAKSCNISLNELLDREQVDQYTVLFEVRDIFNTISRYSTLFVLDVNDNAPSFINLPYRAEVPEDAVLGTFVHKVSATDPDTGIWGLVSYSISGFLYPIYVPSPTRDGLFAISSATGNVTLNGSLDYEQEQFYQLEIMAADGGGLNSTTDLIINVLDVQDTAPYFLNLPYIASVYENATVGTQLMQVTAIDGDRGIPNPVNYTFSQGDYFYFAVDTYTGNLTVKTPMDRENPYVLDKQGVMEMVVLTEEDTEFPQGPTTAIAPVTIRILDVNDQIPTFNQSHYEASVPENTQAAVPVTLIPAGTEIIVRDMDERDNGRFRLSLQQDNNVFEVFEPYPNSVLNEAQVLLRVKNSTALDYEEVHNYTFTIVAKEHLTPEKHEGRTSVTVHLIDVNDNWPEFDAEYYNATIEENSPRGTPVITITATDRDSGIFGEVTYSVRGGQAQLFAVDDKTGAVTVNVDADLDHTLLDREKVDLYFLTFEATDGGGLRSLVQLSILLSDVNDNAPVISRPYYEGFVKENAALLDRPLVIEATDVDLPPNNIITLSIIAGAYQSNFSLNSSTGDLTLTAPLNYEALDPSIDGGIVLRVEARDGGTPSLNTSTDVTINVQDMNDNEPYFSPDMYWAVIPENTTGGTEVSDVFAFDDDGTAPNNEFVYRIESGARDKFRIDANTGLIVVEYGADLDRDVYEKEYTLIVVAIDRGTPPLTGSAAVNVTITDVNNKPPVFMPDSRITKILENTTVDVEFYKYEAFDPDENALLVYSLLDEEVYGVDEAGQEITNKTYLSGLFGIRSDTSMVYVKSPLDRETAEEITITIFVKDVNAEQPPFQNATARLTVILEDVNDNPPIFTPSDVYYARISEASQPGVEVTRVVAIDLDKNPRPVEFFMEHDMSPSGNYSRSFEILAENKLSGIITLATEVDHEETKWINVSVKAVDSGAPPLSSLATVHIDIEDVNDNSPEWQVFETPVYVLENATLFTNVTTVYATDRDSGEFGRVMYFITEGHDDKFMVYNESGDIVTSGLLDRETVPSYLITVVASDNNFAPPAQRRTTPRTMQVVLVDVNDNHPQFDQSSYNATVLENAPLNFIVTKITATDPDEGPNGEVTYIIDNTAGNATDLFVIHPDTGEVTVAKSLQGQMGDFYLRIVASDKGHPMLSNTTTLHIFIQDVNEYDPEIYSPPLNTTIFIWENVSIGYLVTQVNARDLDEGRNGMVEYRFSDVANSNDTDSFLIDRYSGNVTTRREIDREKQDFYLVKVVAYDLGIVSREDHRDLFISVLDRDDNPPVFDRGKYPPPHRVSVQEEVGDVWVADLGLADEPDVGANAEICYYIVGGDRPYMLQFTMNKTNGHLYLDQKLDREEVAFVDLIIKATHIHCNTDFYERDENRNVQWDPRDVSLLLVTVTVIDINDNPPQFSKKWFTAGVTRDTQFGEEVINLAEYAHDPDEGENARMTFLISTPFQITEQLERDLAGRAPFMLGRDSGIITTNVYFQEVWRGYVEFGVSVNDSKPEHTDRANVSIYLLSENQRVKVIIRGEPDEVGRFKDTFAEFVSNITDTIINVDNIRTHRDENGNPDEKRTDMFIHGIDRELGEVLEANVLIDLIDRNYRHLVDLFKQYNVIEVVLALEPEVATGNNSDLFLALIIVAVGLGLIILIVISTFVFCRKKYKRKLQAANAMAFGATDNGLNRLELPGTNMHSFEGSNPIWLEQYGNGWPQDSDTESKNSLDENDVDAAKKTSKGFDEQEKSMRLFNDEYDHYNRAQSARNHDTDAHLKAALNQHESMTSPQESSVPSQHGSSPRASEASSSKNNGVAAKNNGKLREKSNGQANNGDVPNVYHNRGFQMQATEI